MDTFERNAARILAVAYNAYLEASVVKHDDASCRVWARLLLRAQRDTGIELLSPDSLLYWLTGDAVATRKAVVIHRDDALCEPGAELAAELGKARAAQSGDDDGGALVPAPKPIPRKPSPGASVSPAASAAAFFATRA